MLIVFTYPKPMLIVIAHQILASAILPLAAAIDVNNAVDSTVNAQGGGRQPARWLRREKERKRAIDGQDAEQIAAPEKEQPSMMRRAMTSSLYQQSPPSKNFIAPVSVHVSSLISATNGSEKQEMENAENGIAYQPYIEANASQNVSANTSQNASANTSQNASTDVDPAPAYATFELQGVPYHHMHHQVQQISTNQWPANFCVNVKFVAPGVGLEAIVEGERALLVLGGTAGCGSFWIYIDSWNKPGMGVKCRSHNSDADLKGDPLDSEHEHFLQFCYDTQGGEAKIWQDHHLSTNSSKNWFFDRMGQTTVFVGSHDLDHFEEKLEVGDNATLKQMYITDNSADPVTTTTTTVITTTTTTTGLSIVELIPQNQPIGVEVDVNSGPPAPPPTPLPVVIYITSSTTPYWDRTHHEELMNGTNVEDTKTEVVRTEITTVTEYDTNITDDHKRNIDIPGPPTNAHTHVESVTVTVLPSVSESHPVVDWIEPTPKPDHPVNPGPVQPITWQSANEQLR